MSGSVLKLALQLRKDHEDNLCIRKVVEEFISSLCMLARSCPSIEAKSSFLCAIAEVPVDFSDAFKILGHGSQINRSKNLFSIQIVIIELSELSLAHSTDL